MVSIVVFIGVTTVIFGIAALILASRARSKLSRGSIKSFIDHFSICLSFIVVFSLWQTLRSIFQLDISLSSFSGYPELIFIVFAYIAFIIASYRVAKISEEFGFVKEGKEIGAILVKKRINKKNE